ncbi:arginine repressor [Lentilactobacillus laojiaonis]|uniref:arginine repressor n=1 Tax=Lentilactobacillus laojiaonis TaxID=2883998 RepID=UPI001D0A7FFB|nr:ArgR family transcriptional regulator [Lentilactobacillus laojiaonis]UDM32641.1 ArgR family transcriptional regulator [Lentilactobacillus laojiaonis]
MKKIERQNIIKKILKDNEIENQIDFVNKLEQLGIYTTQATISRDIKEMQLVKVPSKSGNYYYSLPNKSNNGVAAKLKQALSDSFVGIAKQNEFINLKTLPGSGPVIANLIDKIDYQEVFATVGDDNSVLIICKNEDATKRIFNILSDLGNY